MNFDDFLEIQNLIGRYGHIMDEVSSTGGDWAKLGEIFADSAVFDLTPMGLPRLEGLRAIIDAWNLGVHPIGHHVTNPVLEVTGEDTARCDTKLIVILADGRSSTGVYNDELVRTPAGWRIAKRTCLVSPFDSSARLPVFASDAAA